MRLPVIKYLNTFIQKNDQDYVLEVIETLEYLTESSAIKDDELDVIGELLSNMYGALEVNTAIKNGKREKEALNEFMQRVTSSIDK
ncbi:hypothetical protein OAU25_02485 [Crocinitomicaceae bacterium]|nr:hypothetical protein [Crocinitomicaceae bacterium]